MESSGFDAGCRQPAAAVSMTQAALIHETIGWDETGRAVRRPARFPSAWDSSWCVSLSIRTGRLPATSVADTTEDDEVFSLNNTIGQADSGALQGTRRPGGGIACASTPSYRQHRLPLVLAQSSRLAAQATGGRDTTLYSNATARRWAWMPTAGRPRQGRFGEPGATPDRLGCILPGQA